MTAHALCIEWVNGPQEFNSIYLALVCGVKLSEPQVRGIFSYSGLYHLMIVSGAHIHMLAKLLSVLRIPFVARSLILLIYVSGCGFQAPSLRAWIQHNVSEGNQQLKLNYNHSLIVFISMGLTLIIIPEKLASLSIVLSGLAALVFSTGKSFLKFKSMWVFLILLPIVSMFSNVHPLSIFINVIAAPLWSLFIFPMTLLAGIIPVFRAITNPVWGALISSLNYLYSQLPFTYFKTPFSLVSAWSYLLVIAVVFYATERRKKDIL